MPPATLRTAVGFSGERSQPTTLELISMKRTTLLCTLPLLLLLGGLTGCSKDDVTVNPPTSTDTVKVSVTPAASTVEVADSVKLTAAVTGSTTTSVTWSVTPMVGSISPDGTYIAPQSIVGDSLVVTVKATSVANTASFATATVTVKGPGFTAIHPRVGSTYVYHIYGVDATGVRLPNTDNDIIVKVGLSDAAYRGQSSVSAFVQQGDSTFIQYKPSGDILMGYVIDAQGTMAWLGMPFGTKQPVQATVVDQTDGTGSRYTYLYSATYSGTDTVMVGTEALPVIKVKVTTVSTRTGDNAHSTTIVTDYAYAPSIGWCGKIDDQVTRVDDSGTLVNGTVTTLTNYLLQ